MDKICLRFDVSFLSYLNTNLENLNISVCFLYGRIFLYAKFDVSSLYIYGDIIAIIYNRQIM